MRRAKPATSTTSTSLEIDTLSVRLSERENEITRLTALVADREGVVVALRDLVAHHEATIASLRQLIDDRDRRDAEEDVAIVANQQNIPTEKRAALLALRLHDPESFRTLYPRIEPWREYLTMNLTDRRPPGVPETVVDQPLSTTAYGETFQQTTKRIMRERNVDYATAQNLAVKMRST